MNNRIVVGGLMLEEHEKWSFSCHHDIIVGMRVDDVGVRRIRYVPRNVISGQLDHENCRETARMLLVVPAGEVSEIEMRDTPSGPFGAATYAGRNDVQRVWYCTRPSGFIAGVYICPADVAGDATHKMICRECARIMAMAIFDRTAWGADDPLTLALMEGLEQAERERSER